MGGPQGFGGGLGRQPQSGGMVPGTMTLTQHLQADSMNRSPQQQPQRFSLQGEHVMPPVVNEPKQIPTTLYGDPILSDHVRSASHDSGLGGPTTFPYQSDAPMMDYDDGMDTSGGMQAMKFQPGIRGPPNRTLENYLEGMPSTEVDSSFPDPNSAMDTELLSGGLPSGMGGDMFNDNMGQWV